jgi:SWI/SNF chromatin-remodeling complex subunit SWI1
MQGTLAADILSGFADNNTARSWLESIDGFATSFLRMACLLSADRTTQGPMRHGQPTRVYEPDSYGYTSIANRALSILCRLAEKSKRVDGKPWVPFSVLPKKENLLGALLSPNIDPNIVRQLCEYTALG